MPSSFNPHLVQTMLSTDCAERTGRNNNCAIAIITIHIKILDGSHNLLSFLFWSNYILSHLEELVKREFEFSQTFSPDIVSTASP